MMGFGYLGNGGSASSSSSQSNLSPLAAPFTVDRSNTKSNSSPLTNVTEVPPYGVPYSSSLTNWHYPHSSAPIPDYFSGSKLDSLNIGTLQSANEYCYLGSESINPPGTHWASSDPDTINAASNQFSYPGGPKKYYPSYASPVVDDGAPMVGLNEASYDLLSSSGLVPMVGSSHGDYSQGLSSLDFSPPSGGLWNGLPDVKQATGTEAGRSFHLEETCFPRSNAYRDYLKRGGTSVECLRCEDTPTIAQRKYAGVFGTEENAGYLAKEQFDDKLGQNWGFMPIESSNAPTFRTSPRFSENHLQSPSLEPATFYSNHQESYSPYEKSFQLFDSCINDCTSVTMTSLMPVIREPALGTKLAASDTIACKSIGMGNLAVEKKKDLSSYNQSIEEEPLLPPSSEEVKKDIYLDGNHLSFHVGRNDQHIYASASPSGEMLTKPLSRNMLDSAIKVRGAQVPDVNIPHAFTSSVVHTEAFKHTANGTETLDCHNSAEDSPCWKGSPSSSVSPFETSEVMPPQIVMKKLEVGNSLDFQVPQMFPPYNDSVIDFSHEASRPNLQNESLPMNNLRVSIPAKEHLAADTARLKSDSVQLVTSDADQYSKNGRNPIKEYDLLNVSTSDSGSIQSQNKQLYPEELNFTSKSEIHFQAGAVDEGICTSETSENGCIPLHAVENVLYSPPSKEDAEKPHAMGLGPKMNIQTLVNSLHNLSELVLLYSSDDEWLLREQDRKTLQHAISNIKLCLSKKIVQLTPGQESVFRKASISHTFAEGATKVGPYAMNEIGIDTHGQLDSYSIHEQKKKCGVLDKNFEQNLDVASLRIDVDTARHHNVVQNIKNVLDECYPIQEDISSKSLLYKNLWLDAEAELCLTGLKSRFDRVKIQTENCNSGEAIEKSIVVEKAPGSVMSPDPDLDVPSGPTPEDNTIPKQKAYVHTASPKSHVNDVEASVMARFQILKCRGDNSSNVEENQRLDVVQPNVTDLGAPWRTVGSQSSNKGFDVAVGSGVQHHTDHSNEKSAGSSLDEPQQETTEVRLRDQLSSGSGWYENSSSDWEHVLKDDFA